MDAGSYGNSCFANERSPKCSRSVNDIYVHYTFNHSDHPVLQWIVGSGFCHRFLGHAFCIVNTFFDFGCF